MQDTASFDSSVPASSGSTTSASATDRLAALLQELQAEQSLSNDMSAMAATNSVATQTADSTSPTSSATLTSTPVASVAEETDAVVQDSPLELEYTAFSRIINQVGERFKTGKPTLTELLQLARVETGKATKVERSAKPTEMSPSSITEQPKAAEVVPVAQPIEVPTTVSASTSSLTQRMIADSAAPVASSFSQVDSSRTQSESSSSQRVVQRYLQRLRQHVVQYGKLSLTQFASRATV